VHVRRECAAEAEAIGAGLLLGDAPLRPAALLHPLQVVHELRPLDPCLALDQTGARIEPQYAVHDRCVDDPTVGQELLAAHSVAGPVNTERLAGAPGVAYDRLQLRHRNRPVHASHRGEVEPRVHVVQPGSGRGARWSYDGRRQEGARAELEESTSCQHRSGTSPVEVKMSPGDPGKAGRARARQSWSE
jgi:hypothetical protein